MRVGTERGREHGDVVQHEALPSNAHTPERGIGWVERGVTKVYESWLHRGSQGGRKGIVKGSQNRDWYLMTAGGRPSMRVGTPWSEGGNAGMSVSMKRFCEASARSTATMSACTRYSRDSHG